MRYSLLGKTGMNVSALGFGCMRLPMDGGKVDRTLSNAMLRRAVDAGVNFFDTAVMYCGGDSQAALGDAVKGMRGKVFISTKNPGSHASADEYWRTLEESLRLMQTDYIDLYNHHGIGWDTFVKHLDPDKGGRAKEMIRAREEGLVRHIGFSFHDAPENLYKLVDTGIYETVILQYNLLDQANADAIQYAHEKGMGVIVMGPVGGGRLGLSSEKILELTGAKSTPEAALRFVWAHPGVNVALSGMGNLAMLDENVALAANAKPFGREEIAGLNNLVSDRKRKSGLYCTACRYCMPACAQGVKIPENLDLLNQALIFGLVDGAKDRYGWLDVKAVDCINCGKCVSLCPQGIKIPEKLAQTARLLDAASGTISCTAAVNEISADGACTVGLKVFNFIDRVRDASVSLSSATGMTFDNNELSFSGLRAMARKSASLSGKIPLVEGRQSASATVSYDGVSHAVDRVCDLLIAPRATADWQGGAWHSTVPTEHDFAGAKESRDKHGFRFRLVHNNDSLTVLADVRDDFLAPSIAERHKGALVDGLELYLDGRGKNVGRGAYEQGVFQVLVYPGTPGSAPAFYHCSQGQGLGPIDVAGERTRHGYRLTIRLPFASFCIDQGKPDRIGFDLGANTADEGGGRIGQYVFAGTKNNWRDASKFIPVWLV